MTTMEFVIGKPKDCPISTAFCDRPCSAGAGVSVAVPAGWLRPGEGHRGVRRRPAGRRRRGADHHHRASRQSREHAGETPTPHSGSVDHSRSTTSWTARHVPRRAHDSYPDDAPIGRGPGRRDAGKRSPVFRAFSAMPEDTRVRGSLAAAERCSLVVDEVFFTAVPGGDDRSRAVWNAKCY